MKRLAWLALLFAANVSAGVVYDWREITVNPDLGNVAARIEFADDVWLSGGYTATFNRYGRARPVRASEFGVVALFVDAWGTIDMGGAPCSVVSTHCEEFGIGADELVLERPGFLDIAVSFGSILSGFVNVAWSMQYDLGPFARFSDFTLRAGYDSATVGRACGGPLCEALGVWVLDQSTVPLDEPPLFALLLLAAIAGVRRIPRR